MTESSAIILNTELEKIDEVPLEKNASDSRGGFAKSSHDPNTFYKQAYTG
jgi:hypothetical protein